MTPQLTLRAMGAAMALSTCSIFAVPATAGATSTDPGAPAAEIVQTAPTAQAAASPRRARLTVTRRRLNVERGRTAFVSGTLHAVTRSERVVLQRLGGSGWATIARDHTDRRGRYRLSYRTTTATSQIVRVRFSGDKTLRPAARRVGRLNVFRDTFASWYGPGFFGRRTACGMTFSATVMGVAHRTLPCGTRLMLRHGLRIARVRVIDRGPFNFGREFDLSPAVKRALAFGSTGPLGTTV